jgi:hypothetical protein
MSFSRWSLPACLLCAGPWPRATARGADAGDRAASLTYEQHVRPILKAHCFQCHGEQEKPKAKLDLRLVRLLRRGGRSGEAIVPGRHECTWVGPGAEPWTSGR